MTDKTSPTSEEVAVAAEIISRLPKGYLPFPLFVAVTSKVVTPTLELVILHEIDGVMHVVLTRRPDDDTYWPGEWHVPGTVIRSTDTVGTFESCFERIIHDELKGSVEISTPEFVGVKFWDIKRGREVDQIFCVNAASVAELPDDIRLFPLDALPSNLMEHHNEIIAAVIGK